MITIVVPVHNGERTLEGCLRALCAQTGIAEYEILVINDGSTDRTPQIIENVQRETLSVVDGQQSTVNSQRESVNRQASTVDRRLSSDDRAPQSADRSPSSVIGGSSTVNRQPSTDNLGPSSVNRQPSTDNHQPLTSETQHPAPKTQHPLPNTQNPTPTIRQIDIPHSGASSARNQGIREAKGDIVLFTDADCTPAHDWASRLCEPLGSGTAKTRRRQADSLGSESEELREAGVGLEDRRLEVRGQRSEVGETGSEVRGQRSEAGQPPTSSLQPPTSSLQPPAQLLNGSKTHFGGCREV